MAESHAARSPRLARVCVSVCVFYLCSTGIVHPAKRIKADSIYLNPIWNTSNTRWESPTSKLRVDIVSVLYTAAGNYWGGGQ